MSEQQRRPTSQPVPGERLLLIVHELALAGRSLTVRVYQVASTSSRSITVEQADDYASTRGFRVVAVDEVDNEFAIFVARETAEAIYRADYHLAEADSEPIPVDNLVNSLIPALEIVGNRQRDVGELVCREPQPHLVKKARAVPAKSAAAASKNAHLVAKQQDKRAVRTMKTTDRALHAIASAHSADVAQGQPADTEEPLSPRSKSARKSSKGGILHRMVLADEKPLWISGLASIADETSEQSGDTATAFTEVPAEANSVHSIDIPKPAIAVSKRVKPDRKGKHQGLQDRREKERKNRLFAAQPAPLTKDRKSDPAITTPHAVNVALSRLSLPSTSALARVVLAKQAFMEILRVEQHASEQEQFLRKRSHRGARHVLKDEHESERLLGVEITDERPERNIKLLGSPRTDDYGYEEKIHLSERIRRNSLVRDANGNLRRPSTSSSRRPSSASAHTAERTELMASLSTPILPTRSGSSTALTPVGIPADRPISPQRLRPITSAFEATAPSESQQDIQPEAPVDSMNGISEAEQQLEDPDATRSTPRIAVDVPDTALLLDSRDDDKNAVDVDSEAQDTESRNQIIEIHEPERDEQPEPMEPIEELTKTEATSVTAVIQQEYEQNVERLQSPRNAAQWDEQVGQAEEVPQSSFTVEQAITAAVEQDLNADSPTPIQENTENKASPRPEISHSPSAAASTADQVPEEPHVTDYCPSVELLEDAELQQNEDVRDTSRVQEIVIIEAEASADAVDLAPQDQAVCTPFTLSSETFEGRTEIASVSGDQGDQDASETRSEIIPVPSARHASPPEPSTTTQEAKDHINVAAQSATLDEATQLPLINPVREAKPSVADVIEFPSPVAVPNSVEKNLNQTTFTTAKRNSRSKPSPERKASRTPGGNTAGTSDASKATTPSLRQMRSPGTNGEAKSRRRPSVVLSHIKLGGDSSEPVVSPSRRKSVALKTIPSGFALGEYASDQNASTLTALKAGTHTKNKQAKRRPLQHAATQVHLPSEYHAKWSKWVHGRHVVDKVSCLRLEEIVLQDLHNETNLLKLGLRYARFPGASLPAVLLLEHSSTASTSHSGIPGTHEYWNWLGNAHFNIFLRSRKFMPAAKFHLNKCLQAFTHAFAYIESMADPLLLLRYAICLFWRKGESDLEQTNEIFHELFTKFASFCEKDRLNLLFLHFQVLFCLKMHQEAMDCMHAIISLHRVATEAKGESTASSTAASMSPPYDTMDYMLMLVHCQQIMGDYVQASATFSSILKAKSIHQEGALSDDEYLDFWYNLADRCFYHEDYVLAMEYYSIALTFAKDSLVLATMLYNRGLCHQSVGETAKCMAEFKRARNVNRHVLPPITIADLREGYEEQFALLLRKPVGQLIEEVRVTLYDKAVKRLQRIFRRRKILLAQQIEAAKADASQSSMPAAKNASNTDPSARAALLGLIRANSSLSNHGLPDASSLDPQTGGSSLGDEQQIRLREQFLIRKNTAIALLDSLRSDPRYHTPSPSPAKTGEGSKRAVISKQGTISVRSGLLSPEAKHPQRRRHDSMDSFYKVCAADAVVAEGHANPVMV